MNKLFFFSIVSFLLATLICCNSMDTNISGENDKSQILALEEKWLTAEFALDTAYLSSIMDAGFIDISANEVHGKDIALFNIYQNISQRIKDSIIVDSFKIEDAIVNLYQNSAVVTSIIHTFRRDKGIKAEPKTRFFDVWIKRNNNWKAVASQGTIVE